MYIQPMIDDELDYDKARDEYKENIKKLVSLSKDTKQAISLEYAKLIFQDEINRIENGVVYKPLRIIPFHADNTLVKQLFDDMMLKYKLNKLKI